MQHAINMVMKVMSFLIDVCLIWLTNDTRQENTQQSVQYDGQEVMALHTLQQDLIWFIE